MQSLNNLSPRGRQFLIGAVTIFVALPLFYVLYTTTQNSDPNKPGVYTDKGSGETVTNNKQAPQTYGTNGESITYLGVSELLMVGVSKYQVAALKSALESYAKTLSPEAKEFSITTKTIKVASRDPESEDTSESVDFDLVVDRKTTYKATLRYFDLSSAQLTIKTKRGEQVYTSKEIDGSQLSTSE